MGIATLLAVPAVGTASLISIALQTAAGGALVGAGMSSGVNTVKQIFNGEPEGFDFKKWVADVCIGGVGGAL